MTIFDHDGREGDSAPAADSFEHESNALAPIGATNYTDPSDMAVLAALQVEMDAYADRPLTRFESAAARWAHGGLTGARALVWSTAGLLVAAMWMVRDGAVLLSQAAVLKGVGLVVGMMLLAMAAMVVADRVHDYLDIGDETRCPWCRCQCTGHDGDDQDDDVPAGGVS